MSDEIFDVQKNEYDKITAALKEYFGQFPEYADRIKYSKEPLNAAGCRLSPENAALPNAFVPPGRTE